MKQFPFYKQPDSKDCGPTCLKIICKHYGKTQSLEDIRLLTQTVRTGSSLLNLSSAAEKIGFRSLAAKTSLKELKDLPLPCVLHWNDNHYVVLYRIENKKFYISDPAHGRLKINEEQFLKFWIGNQAKTTTEEGVVLLLETTPDFYKINLKHKNRLNSYQFLMTYLFKYKSFLLQLIIGLLAGSLLQLAFPFITQAVVDIGIRYKDINFIYLMLFAQTSLFIGRTSLEIIRSWILLHLSTRINISLISDFFIKLMNLPIAFFDTRVTGDILQRINDHRRIERVLTTSSLNVLFSFFNIIIFGLVLLYYNLQIFLIFLFGSVLYFLWISIFLKKREIIDYERFNCISSEQSKVIEIINGMQEIKLYNAEKQKRWEWERLQAKLFKISISDLSLEQYQSVGSRFINEFKNILITFLAASLVVQGEITLGAMLAITYIVGQLNSPISQIINFIRELQDARISLDRLAEIHEKQSEDHNINPLSIDTLQDFSYNFYLNDVSFKYPGSNHIVLKNLTLKIPSKKITAIVGTSGSGKTTLMKLLMKFYSPTDGEIKFGDMDLSNISQFEWRENLGAVMQEGYIFNDTIAKNIAVGSSEIDKSRLAQAVKVANIRSFIESLPKSYNTQIGNEGIGMSSGQKQRILIARAVYKNPKFLLFDEATSALDTNNEKVIMQNLKEFFRNKTVVIIAHRLSTVKNADQIIVIDQGKIQEIGNHNDLIKAKGAYFDLVKNQLELAK